VDTVSRRTSLPCLHAWDGTGGVFALFFFRLKSRRWREVGVLTVDLTQNVDTCRIVDVAAYGWGDI